MLKERFSVIVKRVGPILLALVVGLAGGVLFDRYVLARLDSYPYPTIPSDARPQFRLMGEAWQVIEREYVDQEATDPQCMAYGALEGMVRSLGDTGHSRFLSPEMVRRHDDFTAGEFEGIGAYVEMKDGRVVIVAPIDGSPAQRVGLEAGDVILRVDGQDVTNLPMDAVVSRITGPAGTAVSLTILDPQTDETRQVTVERAEIELDNVKWMRLPGTSVAYVRIVAFSRGVSDDLETTLEEIERRQEIGGIILDLRNNPGGLLSQAVGVTSQFLDEGRVLLRKDAQGKTTPVSVRPGLETIELPLAVLVNGGTASAAEIVTGALQDADRATIVGQTTFGTGTVLNEFGLSDGSALLLAVEEWRTPEGRTIWHTGLEPDIEVALPVDADPFSLPQMEDVTADQLQESDDAQLLRALEALGR